MGKNPELGKLDELFSQEKDFQITNTTYEERTGVALPKTISYIKHGSALARKAAEHGYEIVDIRDEPTVIRTVFFKKK